MFDDVLYREQSVWSLLEGARQGNVNAAPALDETFVADDARAVVGFGTANVATHTSAASLTEGTHVDTAEGSVAVETLVPGTMLCTAEGGLTAVRAVLRSVAPGFGSTAPVFVRAGTLGARRDVTIAPGTRVLVSGWDAEILCGTPDILVSAAQLDTAPGISRAPAPVVVYYHIVTERHEVICAEGIALESYHLAPEDVRAVQHGTQTPLTHVIMRHLPHVLQCASAPAFPVAAEHEALILAQNIKSYAA